MRNAIIALIISTLFLLTPISNTGSGETEEYPPLMETHSIPPTRAGTNDSFSIVLLPDTQEYSSGYPHIFTNQTEWIRDHRYEYNIQYVLHEGDITDNNIVEQWNNSNNSMRVLDGHVPYTLTTGNHDLGPNGNAANRDTYLNDFFPSPQYENWSTFGGAYNKGELENTYHLFSEAGLDWMIVSLEFAPRDAVLDWANRIISDHPGRMVMVVTHNYLAGNARNPWLGGSYGVENDPAGANTGEEIWQKCIKRHKNIICVFSGHILVESGYLASTGNHGNTVHQMLANFQMNERGGDGYLRILEFNTSAGSIEVRTYSPYQDQYKNESNHNFNLTFNRWDYVNYVPYILNNVTDMNMQEDQLKGFLDLDGTSLPSSGIFSDPDLGDSMKFQLWNGREWILLNEGNRYLMRSKIFTMLGNGSLMIEPEENHFCEEDLKFRAVDRMGAKAEHRVKLQIRPINDPPELDPIQDWTFHTRPKGIKGTIITVLEETLLDMTITAEDLIEPWDRENFTFSSNASDHCPFFEVDPGGRVSFTPNNDDVGTYDLTITVDDGNDYDQYDDMNIKLVIENVNDPPEITTTGVLECWEDQLYIVEYQAHDADPGDPDLTWTLDTDAGFLTMGRNTGLLQGTPDNDDVGTYDLIITVEDGPGATDMTHFQLTVHNVNDPPVPYVEHEAYYIDEDTGLILSLFDRFHDDDDMILSYSIDQGINISTQIIEDRAYFSPERDWSGEETFNITATDGIDSAFMIFNLIYLPVDDSPTGATIHLLQEEYFEGEPQLVSGTGYDPDIPYGDSIELIWLSDTRDHIGSGEVVNLSLPAGHHIIVLKVMDGTGRSFEVSLGLTILQREEEENQTVPDEGNESRSTRNEAYCFLYLITPVIIIAAIFFTIIGIKIYRKKEDRSVDGAGPDEVHVADEDLSTLLPP